MESVIAELNKIDLAQIINIEIGAGELLIDTRPVPPAMVNKLFRVKLPTHVTSSKAVRELKRLIRSAEMREHRREEASTSNI